MTSAVSKRMQRPIRPIHAMMRRKIKPFLPPFASTLAPKGMRRREPVSDGIATNRPTSVGVRFIAAASVELVGPKREIAITPKKKPMVAPNSA